MRHNKNTTGFTLIELMLAMTFVAFILVFMSLSIVQMLRTYDKGLSMKQVNQAGRSVVDDISQAVRSQLPSDIRTDNVDAGALCIGSTIYLWNPLYTGEELDGNTLVRTDHSAVEGDPVTGGMMAKKKLIDQSDDCDKDSPTSESTTLLSNRTRVLWADADRTIDQRLIKLRFAIGTYDRDEVADLEQSKKLIASPFDTFYLTPHLEGPPAGKHFSCLPGDAGNYCAFSEFSTVIYLSKEQQ